jgi:hypothetical protein
MAADVSAADAVVGVCEGSGVALAVSKRELAVDGSSVGDVDVVDAALFHVWEVAESDGGSGQRLGGCKRGEKDCRGHEECAGLQHGCYILVRRLSTAGR